MRLSIESVLPHLLLDKTSAEHAGVEGMQYVMSQPLRDRRNQPALWSALASGLIDTIGTDHCPFDKDQKLLGRDAFTQIPNGIPGIEERVCLMYTYGVNRGLMAMSRFSLTHLLNPVSYQTNTRRLSASASNDDDS